MLSSAGMPAVIAAVLLLAGGTFATAQGVGPAAKCPVHAGEASAPSRDAALRQAFEAVVLATDPKIWKAWTARGRILGDAPGYQVTRLTTKCTPRGSNLVCLVEATMCKS